MISISKCKRGVEIRCDAPGCEAWEAITAGPAMKAGRYDKRTADLIQLCKMTGWTVESDKHLCESHVVSASTAEPPFSAKIPE